MNGFFMFPSLFPCVYAKGRIQEVSKGECGGGGTIAQFLSTPSGSRSFTLKTNRNLANKKGKTPPFI